MKSCVVSSLDPKSSEAEIFRSLRTNVLFSEVDASFKVIAITSTQPNEGKSVIAANYAVSLASMGKKVLLMDCDLRKPTVASIFEAKRGIGITNALLSERPLAKCIQQTEVERLYIMDCGPLPPNPAEIMGSGKMRNLIAELRDKFDYILIDTPPVGVVSDALTIKDAVDGYILTVEIDRIKKEKLARVMENIHNTGTFVIGTVINKVPVKHSSYYGYYYGAEEYGK
ncbi:MAG: CpsD/CapB family tyrosine-protein kinase [Eubacterium sp.]|nr:CpsD/CapB family tyrosine-protein kinase [Eubacterium sp.]